MEDPQPPRDELALPDDAQIQPTEAARKPAHTAATRAAERLKRWTTEILEKEAVDS